MTRVIPYEIDLVNNRVIISLDLDLAKKIESALLTACYHWNFPPHDLHDEMKEITGILKEIAANGNSVKEEERMNQLFCETTEELFCEITENLELTQKNKELFRIFLHSLDTEEMRIFILNRLFVRRIARNGEEWE